jgi:hypothetical protein
MEPIKQWEVTRFNALAIRRARLDSKIDFEGDWTDPDQIVLLVLDVGKERKRLDSFLEEDCGTDIAFIEVCPNLALYSVPFDIQTHVVPRLTQGAFESINGANGPRPIAIRFPGFWAKLTPDGSGKCELLIRPFKPNIDLHAGLASELANAGAWGALILSFPDYQIEVDEGDDPSQIKAAYGQDEEYGQPEFPAVRDSAVAALKQFEADLRGVQSDKDLAPIKLIEAGRGLQARQSGWKIEVAPDLAQSQGQPMFPVLRDEAVRRLQQLAADLSSARPDKVLPAGIALIEFGEGFYYGRDGWNVEITRA